MRAPAARPRLPYGLFLALLAVDVLLALCEKQAALGAGAVGGTLWRALAAQPLMWIGLGLGPVQLWVWMRILARTELSVAYSVSSLSYPLIMLAAQGVFHERLGWPVWLGAMLIAVGVTIVGVRGGASPSERRVPS